MYVLSYVTSVRLSSWINKGDYYYYYFYIVIMTVAWLYQACTVACVYVYLASSAVVPLNSYWSDADSCCVQSVYCRPCHDNEHTTTWLGVEVKALLANCCPRLRPHQASAFKFSYVLVITRPFGSDRQHLSCDRCLEVRGEIIRTVLCCIVY